MVCESQELRAFLSRDSPFIAKAAPEAVVKEGAAFPGQNIVRNMYRSFAESIDEVFFGPSMLDVMIGRLTRQAAEFAGIVGSGVKIGAGSRIQKGCLVGNGVVLGPKAKLSEFERVSKRKEVTDEEDEDEGDAAEDSSSPSLVAEET